MLVGPQLQLALPLALLVILLHILAAAPPQASSAAERNRLIEDKNYPRPEMELQAANLDHSARVYFAGILPTEAIVAPKP